MTSIHSQKNAVTATQSHNRRVGPIRAGIGGWSYAPWKASFYPPGLPQKSWLDYASRQVNTIEVNATFYGAQSAASFARWHAAAPEGFVFAVKAPRVATHRRDLAEAGESVHRFLQGGLAGLAEKLGPLVWQFPPAKAFVADEFAQFLDLLKPELNGLRLRHALDVRNASFAVPEFVGLARERGVGIVYTDAADVPQIADPTADFVYARLRQARADHPHGYSAAELKHWRDRSIVWQRGQVPDDLPLIDLKAVQVQPRVVFIQFINGEKVKAPAAAQELLRLLREESLVI